MTDRLNVYLRADKVGQLWLDARRHFVFQYDADWLARKEAIPLSLRLPLQSETFDDGPARPFFANLLPESELRRVFARKMGLSEQNDFALLEAVGGNVPVRSACYRKRVCRPAKAAIVVWMTKS